MTTVPDNLEELLLDYHLGQLSGDDSDRVARLISEHAAVAEASRRVAAVVGRLGAYEVPEPSADLAAGICRRIEQYRETTVRLDEVAEAEPSGGEAVAASGGGWGWSNLLTVAASLLIIAGLLVPGVRRVQSMNRQAVCRTNLAGMGQAAAGYAVDYNEALPFAGHVPSGSWLPVRQRHIQFAPNSRHFFLLAKGGYVPGMHVFVCPSDPNGQVMDAGEVGRLVAFRSPGNISYSSQSQGVSGLRITLSPRMPLMSDPNPFVGGGRFVVAGRADENSAMHGRTGQNVLYCDGAVLWAPRPTAGPLDDNIWLAGTRREYRGTEVPLHSTDAFLIP